MNKTIAILLLAVGLTARGATVVGNINDGVLGDALTNATVVFMPQLTPLGIGNATYLDVTKKVHSDAVGAFSISLVGGVYIVNTGYGTRNIVIVVPPNDTATYQFNDVTDVRLLLSSIGGTNYYSNVWVTNNFSVLSNAYFYGSLRFAEQSWAGPTNYLDFAYSRYYYATYTPVWVSGFSNYVAGFSHPSVLEVYNASSTNVDIFASPDTRIPANNTSPYTLTNGDLAVLSFEYVNGRTNLVIRQFH